MKNAETNDFARKIRADYLVGRSETDADAEALGKLIKKINRPAKIFGYVFGIAGLLLFGAGMCVTLTAAADFFAAGVIVSLTGASMMVLDRPLYDTALPSAETNIRAKFSLSADVCSKTEPERLPRKRKQIYQIFSEVRTMKEFHPFRDMKESAKAQHEIDKAEFEAVKAESKANREEAKLLSKAAKLKAKKEHDDRIAEANARTAAAKERIDAAKKAKEELR